MSDHRPPVIEVRNVAKRFKRAQGGVGRSLRDLGGMVHRTPHWALTDVSLTIRESEALGIVGVNGSGKSTLLRLMSGLTAPTRGSITLHSRISGLLTLGGSFAPVLSAEENALTAAILAGLTPRQARQRLGVIAAFAELEDVMDQPLRTFSDGMRLRLAFAVSINVDPRVLLIDEVMAVGDLRFRRKCLDRLSELHREQAVTVILTSHELEQVEAMCSRAVWLSEGVVAAEGSPEEVTGRYRRSLQPGTGDLVLEGDLLRQGDRAVEITGVRLGAGSGGRTVLQRGDALVVDLDLFAREPVPQVVLGVSVTRDDGTLCLDLTTVRDGVFFGPLHGEQSAQLVLPRVDLAAGVYWVEVGAYSEAFAQAHDVHSGGYRFEVVGPRTKALLDPPHDWRLT